MALPGNVNVVRVRGYLFNQNGTGASQLKVMFMPPSPMLLTDVGANSFINLSPLVVTPDPTSGYFFADLVATNDPNLTPTAWTCLIPGQPVLTIAVPYDSPTVDVGGGVMMQALWLTGAATITVPTPSATYYTSAQTDTALAVKAPTVHTHVESDTTGLVAALATKNPQLNPTAVKTGAYTGAVSDFVPVDTTSGAVTVTLPAAPVDKAQIAVKHVLQGAANAVTIACGGSDVINKAGGAVTFTLATLNQGVLLQYASSVGIWYAVTSDVALSQLDLRYASPAYATSRAVALAVVLGS